MGNYIKSLGSISDISDNCDSGDKLVHLLNLIMQQILDTLNATSSAIYPAFKGVLDFTVQIVTGGSPHNNTSATKSIGNIAEKQIMLRNIGTNGFPFNRNLIRIAGLSGALAVALGAYGSHVIEMSKDVDEDRKRSYRSANLYHFIGTFGLIACSLARRPSVSGVLMATGTFIFCGSCYAYAFTADPSYRKYAPFGGTTLILAWLSLIL